MLQHTEDPGLQESLVSLAMLLCTGSSSVLVQIPELLAESLLTALVPASSHAPLPQARPALQAHPAILGLLASLLEAESGAAHHAAAALSHTPDMCHALLSALAQYTIDVHSIDSIISLLRVFGLACAQQGAGRQLSVAAGLPCFLQISYLLHTAASCGTSAGSGITPSALLQLRAACLSLLGTLAKTGCCLLRNSSQHPCDAQHEHQLQPMQLSHLTAAAHHQTQQHVQELGSVLMPGLKPCLLSASLPVKLQATSFLATLCGASHPVLLRRLMQDDLVEYLCEGVRSTLRLAPRQQPGAGSTSRRPGLDGTAAEEADALQASAVTALRYLSLTGPPFFEHLPFALDTLLMLGEGAVSSGNTPLMADVLALINQAMGPEGQGAAGPAIKGGALQQRCIHLVGGCRLSCLSASLATLADQEAHEQAPSEPENIPSTQSCRTTAGQLCIPSTSGARRNSCSPAGSQCQRLYCRL